LVWNGVPLLRRSLKYPARRSSDAPAPSGMPAPAYPVAWRDPAGTSIGPRDSGAVMM
jgi:hypothetical protein